MSENYDGDMESCIGHELAHAWLGHGLNQLPPEAERAADALAEEWGFEQPHGTT